MAFRNPISPIAPQSTVVEYLRPVFQTWIMLRALVDALVSLPQGEAVHKAASTGHRSSPVAFSKLNRCFSSSPEPPWPMYTEIEEKCTVLAAHPCKRSRRRVRPVDRRRCNQPEGYSDFTRFSTTSLPACGSSPPRAPYCQRSGRPNC